MTWLSHRTATTRLSPMAARHRRRQGVTRWIKEAVHIRKEGKSSMNRDEGSYTLSHVYDRFLATSQATILDRKSDSLSRIVACDQLLM